MCEGKTQIGGKQDDVSVCPDLNKEKLEMMKEQQVSRCSAGLRSVLLTVPLEKTVLNDGGKVCLTLDIHSTIFFFFFGHINSLRL